ncbi:MAG: DUF1844 domain-containing protein [Acidimicrobiales bacterium]
MGTIWTPDGDHQPTTTAQAGPDAAGEPSQEELEAQVRAMQDQLRQTPAHVVVANHAFGLFELAAIHLGSQPPQVAEAQLAIDALAALVEGLAGRLGEFETQLHDGLAQLRLAYVQIRAAAAQAAGQQTQQTQD